MKPDIYLFKIPLTDERKDQHISTLVFTETEIREQIPALGDDVIVYDYDQWIESFSTEEKEKFKLLTVDDIFLECI